MKEHGVTTTNYGYENDAFQRRNAKKGLIWNRPGIDRECFQL